MTRMKGQLNRCMRGNGPFQVVDVDLRVAGDGPRPVGDGAAETGHLHAGGRETFSWTSSSLASETAVMFSPSTRRSSMCVPPQFLVRPDLRVDGLAGFVRDAGIEHGELLAVLRAAPAVDSLAECVAG
ncbi:MAG: hypothetical protein ACOX5J_04280 [Candidatus Hydrogenedentales bacterium]